MTHDNICLKELHREYRKDAELLVRRTNIELK